jgi:hypothetical protein
MGLTVMSKVTSSKRHILFAEAEHNPMGTAFSGHWFVYLRGVLIYASLFFVDRALSATGCCRAR